MKTCLKSFIKEIRGITIAEAARQLGCTREYLSGICNGAPAGRGLATKIQAWSGDRLKASELMQLE